MTTARRFGVDVSKQTAAQQLQRDDAPYAHEVFWPLPAPVGQPPFRLPLSEVTQDPTDQLVFHVFGDSGGVMDPTPQEAVAKAMTADLAGDPAATFAYSVGDVVYFNGEDDEYLPQFYEPYDTYPRPIFAIPGNHDGDPFNPTVTSLAGFVTNFCAPKPVITPDAGDMHRDAMTQPNVYWTLDATLATIIGLYSNVPSGGVIHPDQAAWLAGELAAAPTDRALIVSLHHPPYSIDAHHGGSQKMGDVLDAAFKQANVWPDLVLSGHVHDYQRFMRTDTPHPVTYLVIGNSGYHNLHGFAPGAAPGEQVATGVTYEAGIDHQWGFARLTIDGKQISGAAYGLDRTSPAVLVDQWTQPLA